MRGKNNVIKKKKKRRGQKSDQAIKLRD